MIDTTGTRTAAPPRRRWRVRDVVDRAIALDLNETSSELAANGDSRHAERSLWLDSIALLSLPIAFETQPVDQSLGEPSALPVGSPRRWIIVPPAPDPAMQKRAWEFWLQAINSRQGEPRPSTRTMTVQQGTYLACGETRIAFAEFLRV